MPPPTCEPLTVRGHRLFSSRRISLACETTGQSQRSGRVVMTSGKRDVFGVPPLRTSTDTKAIIDRFDPALIDTDGFGLPLPKRQLQFAGRSWQRTTDRHLRHRNADRIPDPRLTLSTSIPIHCRPIRAASESPIG